MLNLDQVTLLCVETRSPQLALFAIQQCTQHAQFKKVVLATDLNITYKYPEYVHTIQTPHIQSTKEYSDFLLSDLREHIDGTHVLIIQWDSFIIHPNSWNPSFLEYDYIGPPWPHHPDYPVGNGGFSLRSKRLISALQDPRILKGHPEDQYICIHNRALLEKDFEIQFAPLHLACKFGVERGIWQEAFGFHGMFNFAKVLTDDQLNEFMNCIPFNFLGGQDTYELITDLIKLDKIRAAKKLLSMSHPKHERKYRYHRMHFKLWLKMLFRTLLRPVS